MSLPFPTKLVLASRKSALARLQSYSVGESLRAAWPGLEVEYLFKESLGDRNLDAPLWQMPEKGVFTRDLQLDLEGGRCDMVVHSWKDLPLEMPGATQIAATMKREDPRDLLLIKREFLQHARQTGRVETFTALSSSPRRAHNLGPNLAGLLPFECGSVSFANIRGNVPTRVAKLLSDPAAGGLVLARAALERLLGPSAVADEEVENFQRSLRADLSRCEWMVLPMKLNPAAPAQGALAVEIRKDREDLRLLLGKIHVPEDFGDVQIERRVLGLFGGGCHQKIGATVIRVGPENQRVLFLKGQRDSGEALDFEGFEEDFSWSRTSPLAKPPSVPSPRELWPARGEVPDVFERAAVDSVPTRSMLGSKPLAFVVARADALPESWTFSSGDFVFASGLETWKKLASRGVWVHGSFEGLGEERLISRLLDPALRYYKFSHSKAPAAEGQLLLASYGLRPKHAAPIVPENVEECFWLSASLFDEALRRDGGLLSRVRAHASGPGHTAQLIGDRVRAAGASFRVYLGPEHWRACRESRNQSGVTE